MEIKKIRDLIVKGLHEETGLLVVDTDNPHKKPVYPYYSYKFTTLRQNTGEGGVYKERFNTSLDPDYRYDVVTTAEFQPYMILSFNCYSDRLLDAQEYIVNAWNWFKFRGRETLSLENIIVVDVGDIQDRSLVIVDHYEYRQGFDITLRVLQQIEKRSETIEEYKIEGGII